jgi:Putative zinc-finger/WD40-like Beta Propeller Repeat
MSRFPRLRRRPDHWSDVHERAMTRLAERMDGPLGLAEATWLDEHLAGCPSCTAVANAYEDDRLALRALRETSPEPPRDLWARTSAGIEAAAPGRGAGSGATRRVPIGALSGVMVVAVVVGVSLLSGGLPIDQPGPAPAATPDIASGGGSSPAASNRPVAVEPTPFAVGAGDVSWVDAGPNGRVYTTAGVKSVCPVSGAAGCPTLHDTRETALAMKGTPRTIISSPSRQQAVAIGNSEDAGDSVIVVALPKGSDDPTPSATASAPTEPPGPTPTAEASASAAPTASSPASSEPSPSASTEPSVEPSAEPSGEASALPTQSPEATAAAEVAIATGVEVVGESAAFSPDGTWFAFTARPADGSGGPDVYAWRVGDAKAVPLTHDGASFFASWSDDEVIASRPADPDAADPRPRTVRIDPATGDEAEAGDLWRPAVDPTGRFAIAWDGTLQRADPADPWVPAEGTLELRPWTADGPAEATGPERDRLVTDEASADYDVRWDGTGEWVAVWVADPRDPTVGRLTLYHVDADRGRLEVVDGAPADVSALPGFSIGDGRLAWVTPRGQGGEGSRIQIAAWSPTSVGIVESSPGEDIVVIR